MMERHKYKGKLLEKEQDIKSKELEVKSHFESLRNLLDPTEPLLNLNGDEIAGHAFNLQKELIELRGLVAEADKIKDVLGR